MLRHPVPGWNFFPRGNLYFSALRIAIRFVSSCGGDSLKILNRSREKNRPFYPVHERRSRISLVSPDKERYLPIFLFLLQLFQRYIHFGRTVVLFTHQQITTLRFAKIEHESTHEHRADTRSRDITRMQIWLRYIVLQLQLLV